jgi:hypothetical protein
MSKLEPTRKLVTEDKTVAYYWQGKMHNWDGPAYIPQGNNKKAEYYLFGIKKTKLEWLMAKRDVNGVPFYKTSIGKTSGLRM